MPLTLVGCIYFVMTVIDLVSPIVDVISAQDVVLLHTNVVHVTHTMLVHIQTVSDLLCVLFCMGVTVVYHSQNGVCVVVMWRIAPIETQCYFVSRRTSAKRTSVPAIVFFVVGVTVAVTVSHALTAPDTTRIEWTAECS